MISAAWHQKQSTVGKTPPDQLDTNEGPGRSGPFYILARVYLAGLAPKLERLKLGFSLDFPRWERSEIPLRRRSSRRRVCGMVAGERNGDVNEEESQPLW